jgi:hypothetical protein
MNHDWRKLTKEEKEEMWKLSSWQRYEITNEFRRCKNCGLTVIPDDGIKDGHRICDPIIVRKIMDD